MCLHVVDEVPTTNRKTGYKVFRTTESPYSTVPLPKGAVRSQFIRDHQLYVEGSWYNSTEGTITSNVFGISTDVRYPKGFHIFLTKQSAQIWADGGYKLSVHRVAFKEVVASGIILHRYDSRSRESQKRVVVARQMKVLERVS